MSVFIDTSAFLTILDADDANNRVAVLAWTDKVNAGDVLETTNYVVVETVAVLHRRHGLSAVRWFVEDMLPVVRVEWVSPETHSVALRSVLAGSRSSPSLVDCVSFETIEKHCIDEVFAYDKHFEQRGFEIIGQAI